MDQEHKTVSAWNWPLFVWGLVVMVVINISPMVLIDSTTGKTNHWMVMFLLMSMSASFVRGVGFVPKHALPRVLLGALAAVLYAAIAAVLYLIHM